jgi:hypothetical protein
MSEIVDDLERLALVLGLSLAFHGGRDAYRYFKHGSFNQISAVIDVVLAVSFVACLVIALRVRGHSARENG